MYSPKLANFSPVYRGSQLFTISFFVFIMNKNTILDFRLHNISILENAAIKEIISKLKISHKNRQGINDKNRVSKR